MKIINSTKSICDVCLKPVPAKIIKKKEGIFIQKHCKKHGKFTERHVWDDPEIYRGLSELETIRAKSAQVTVALTYKCNLNCPVCYARANEMKIEDLDIKDLDKLGDYKVVFLTGGEPTIRKDLPKIIRILRERGKKVILFSNGVKLVNKKYVQLLKKSGLRYVTLQFDTLKDEENKDIRGRNLSKIKKKAVENMEECDLPVLLYAVILKNKNYRNLKDLFNFAFKHKNVKAVGVNPLWKLGRYDKNDFIPSSKIIKETCRVLKVKREDWIQSTTLLCNTDKILSMFSIKRRLFGKCNMKCIVIPYKDGCIPITKIFNTWKINRDIDTIYKSKSYSKLTIFLIYFLFIQIILNFVINKYFRVVIFKTLKNSKYLIKRNYLLLSPFRFISLAIFPTKRNLDFNFVKDCNFHAVSSEDFSFRPACVHRIMAIEKHHNRK